MSFGKKVAILAGSRIPFAKSQTLYLEKSNRDLLGYAINDLVRKTNIKDKLIGDVVAGAVMNHPFDWNLAREAVLESDLSPETPGLTIQRACGTGLEAANIVALKIASNQIQSGISAGTDTNSDIPLIGQRKLTHFLIQLKNAKHFNEKILALKNFRFSLLKPQLLVVREPQTKLSMGEHCELMVKEWDISRKDQDELALRSHQNAAKAYDEGFYDDLIVEIDNIKKDSAIRKDTTIEKLAKLKLAFDKSENGTLTAGNSTPLTDGASAVLLGSPEWAHSNKLEIMAY